MVLFIVLPLRNETQGDAGEIVPGTHASAPLNANLKYKAKLTTYWAFGIWVVVAGTILSGMITVRDLDWFNRMSTPEVSLDAAGDTNE